MEFCSKLLLISTCILIPIAFITAQPQCESCEEQTCNELETSLPPISYCICTKGKFSSTRCDLSAYPHLFLSLSTHHALITLPPVTRTALTGYQVVVAQYLHHEQKEVLTIDGNSTKISDLEPNTRYYLCPVPATTDVSAFKPNRTACLVFSTRQDYSLLYRGIAVAAAVFVLGTVAILLFIDLCGKYLRFDQIIFYNVPDDKDEMPINTENALFKALQTELALTDAREHVIFTKVTRVGRMTSKQPQRPIAAVLASPNHTRFIMAAAARSPRAETRGNQVRFIAPTVAYKTH